MNNETKRDVFDDLVEELVYTFKALESEGIGEGLTNEEKQAYLKDYDAALPDDLPVIPKSVGEYIIDAKAGHNGIGFVLMIGGHAMTSNRIAFEEWLTRVNSYSDRIDRENAFARAWVLDAWRIEETGEIVNLK